MNEAMNKWVFDNKKKNENSSGVHWWPVDSEQPTTTTSGSDISAEMIKRQADKSGRQMQVA